MMAKRITIESMRRRMLRIISETEQIVRDAEWWNANRPDAPPFDVGGDKVVLAKARECLAALDRGDTINPCHSELVEVARRKVAAEDEAIRAAGK